MRYREHKLCNRQAIAGDGAQQAGYISGEEVLQAGLKGDLWPGSFFILKAECHCNAV